MTPLPMSNPDMKAAARRQLQRIQIKFAMMSAAVFL
jgi:hypothetical protein